MGKPPAFQYYPKDFLADPKVAVMTTEEVGAYWLLISFCWIDGSLPDDLEMLARMARLDGQAMARLWPSLSPCFRKDGRGRLYHPRLRREKRSQVKRKQALSRGGMRGAKARWDKQLHGQAIQRPMASDSSASASATAYKKTTPSESATKPPLVKPNKQQERVQAVLDVCPPLDPKRAARVLKLWEGSGGDTACLRCLRQVVDRYPVQPPDYVLQVLETARRNGGKLHNGRQPSDRDERRNAGKTQTYGHLGVDE